MAIKSLVDAPSGGQDEIAHSNWGYETPGGFFPRPYGKHSLESEFIPPQRP